MSRSVALVTGGASGVGAAIAARLRADGLMVTTFDLSPVDAPGAYTVDVTDRDEIEKALVEIPANFGPIDVLVNAAGIEGQSRFLDMSFDEWSHVVNVNLHGVFHCAQAVLPDMMRRRWGRIVNISSSSTHSGVPLKAHYVAAKSAVNGLTKALALEYGPRGITVNGVPPALSILRCSEILLLAVISARSASTTSLRGHRFAASDCPPTLRPSARS